MAYTSHGHHIRGTVREGNFNGSRARCGGPGLCDQCGREAALLLVETSIVNDVVDIPVEGMFASADWRVICREGEYYYLACGQLVYEKPEGGVTSCVKPLGHKTWGHEDYEGRVNDVGVPQTLDSQTSEEIRRILRRTGLDFEQVYNAMNALQVHGIKMTKEP